MEADLLVVLAEKKSIRAGSDSDFNEVANGRCINITSGVMDVVHFSTLAFIQYCGSGSGVDSGINHF